MLKVNFRRYWCDMVSEEFVKTFYDINDFVKYLKCEWENRQHTGLLDYALGIRQYLNMHGSFNLNNIYSTRMGFYGSLQTKKITKDDGTIIFEDNKYCSPKLYDMIPNILNELKPQEKYGDL